MLHMPSPMLMGSGASGPSYADFVAHITGLALGAESWNSDAGTGTFGARKTTVAPPSGNMIGSSWQSYFSGRLSRAIQHGLPSQAEFNAQVSASRQIFFRQVSISNQAVFFDLPRNGYLSEYYSDGSKYAAYTLAEIIYWDGARAWRMQPSLGLGPEPYTW